MLGKSQSQQRLAAVVVAVALSAGVVGSALPSAGMPAAAVVEPLVEAHWPTGRKQNLQNLKDGRWWILNSFCEKV